MRTPLHALALFVALTSTAAAAPDTVVVGFGGATAATGVLAAPAQRSLWFSYEFTGQSSRNKPPVLTDVEVQRMFCAVRFDSPGRSQELADARREPPSEIRGGGA